MQSTEEYVYRFFTLPEASNIVFYVVRDLVMTTLMRSRDGNIHLEASSC